MLSEEKAKPGEKGQNQMCSGDSEESHDWMRITGRYWYPSLNVLTLD